jgi:hypothetical protein
MLMFRHNVQQATGAQDAWLLLQISSNDVAGCTPGQHWQLSRQASHKLMVAGGSYTATCEEWHRDLPCSHEEWQHSHHGSQGCRGHTHCWGLTQLPLQSSHTRGQKVMDPGVREAIALSFARL